MPGFSPIAPGLAPERKFLSRIHSTQNAMERKPLVA
jgi:hypothetical protein